MSLSDYTDNELREELARRQGPPEIKFQVGDKVQWKNIVGASPGTIMTYTVHPNRIAYIVKFWGEDIQIINQEDLKKVG